MTGRGTRSSHVLVAESLVPLLREHADTLDATSSFPVEALAALGEAGLMGLLVPRAQGGMGADLIDLVAVTMTLADACTSTAFVWSMHCQQVDALVRFGDADWTSGVLARVAAGDLYLASVTTEHVKGGHLLSADAALEPEGDGARLLRRAPIVTGGEHADAFLVTMRADPSAPRDVISLVFAERDELDVTVERTWDQSGMRGTANVALELRGLLRPARVVGPPRGFRAVAIESMIPVAHLAWSASWLGAAVGALRRVVRHLRARGRPLSDLEAARLGAIRARLETASAYLWTVAHEVVAARDAGASLDRPPLQIHLNALKVSSSEAARAVVDALVELVGLRDGYERGSALALDRALRDVRAASLTFNDDRLRVATGHLSLLDTAVRLAGAAIEPDEREEDSA